MGNLVFLYSRDFELMFERLGEKEMYWLGYIRADGSLSQSHTGLIRFAFSQKEKEPIFELAAFLNQPEPKFYSGLKTTFGPQSIYQFSFSGIIPKKLLDLGVKAIALPELFHDSVDFWRGMIDGDGCVTWAKAGKYRYPRISLVGSYEDMSLFSTFVGNVLGCKGPSVGKSNSIFQCQVGATKAAILASVLYEGRYSANTKKRNMAKEIAVFRR